MYRLLPFIAAVDSALPVNIPVEIWAIILRNLDPASLLSTIRAEPLLKSIAKGDPILRERVRKQIEEQKARRREEMFNPGLLYSVERNGPGTLFGRNQTKKIHARPPTRDEPLVGFFDQAYQQRKVGGKASKKKNKVSNSPIRKTMRC